MANWHLYISYAGGLSLYTCIWITSTGFLFIQANINNPTTKLKQQRNRVENDRLFLKRKLKQHTVTCSNKTYS